MSKFKKKDNRITGKERAKRKKRFGSVQNQFEKKTEKTFRRNEGTFILVTLWQSKSVNKLSEKCEIVYLVITEKKKLEENSFWIMSKIMNEEKIRRKKKQKYKKHTSDLF